MYAIKIKEKIQNNREIRKMDAEYNLLIRMTRKKIQSILAELTLIQ